MGVLELVVACRPIMMRLSSVLFFCVLTPQAHALKCIFYVTDTDPGPINVNNLPDCTRVTRYGQICTTPSADCVCQTNPTEPCKCQDTLTAMVAGIPNINIVPDACSNTYTANAPINA